MTATDAGGFEALTRAGGLASDFVLALAEDRHGNLLVGTQSGLSVIRDEGEITNYTSDDGLPSNLIFNIRVDDEGAAWIATTQGLARFRDGRFDAVTVRDGLPSEAIYNLAEDEQGRVWLSSAAGIIGLDKRRLEKYLAGGARSLEARLFDESGSSSPRCCRTSSTTPPASPASNPGPGS